MKGGAGSIRQLAVSDNGRQLASVGLDRWNYRLHIIDSLSLSLRLLIFLSDVISIGDVVMVVFFRFLRIYDISKLSAAGSEEGGGKSGAMSSPPLLCAVYLKNRLNRCCFLPALPSSGSGFPEGEKQEDWDGEDDDSGDKLEELGVSDDEDEDDSEGKDEDGDEDEEDELELEEEEEEEIPIKKAKYVASAKNVHVNRVKEHRGGDRTSGGGKRRRR